MKKAALFLTLLLSATSLKAEDLGTLVNNSITAMKAGDWAEALRLNTVAVTEYGADPAAALRKYGSRFGTIWYRKGLCELKLKQFTDAMKSFEACYKDFPNGADGNSGNEFNKMALLKWGEAAMGAEKYEEAITQWEKFIQERDKTKDKYSRGAFHINMAICHFRIKKIDPGIEHLEIAIKNKSVFPTQNASIISGYQVMATAAIEEKKEDLLLDFTDKYRGDLTIAPFEMQRFSRVFMKLAGDAVSAQMYKAALSLYRFVPPTQVAINDLTIHLRDMGNVKRIPDGSSTLLKAKLEEELNILQAEQRGNETMEMIKLAAIAYIQENKLSNVRSAFAAYTELEKFHQAAKNREDNLFHLVRTSSVIGEVFLTQTYGEKFLTLFPESKYKPEVQKLMLAALFFEGKYETCIQIASDIIDNKKAAEGTPEHDLALFVLGGSYYYLLQFDKAGPLLDLHVQKYPESQFIMSSEYFQASNASRLQFWKKAAGLLDNFLTKYKEAPDQTFIPLALYDRANCHYSESEYDPALVKLELVINDHARSGVLELAYNLRGNVQQSKKDLAAAEQSYLKALEVAEVRKNDSVAGEALYYLVNLLGEQQKGKDPNPRLPDAIPFADKYWKEYSVGSPYRAQVAVAQVAAFINGGRAEEARQRLQDVISQMAADPQTVGLEEAINSYTEVYLAEHTPDQLKDHYYSFPIDDKHKAARALLRIAIIGVYEGVAKDAKDDEDKKRAANAMVKVLFDELKRDFALKDLSNFILVKLGDFLRTNTAAPRESLAFYDEALSRQDQAYRFNALLGRADVYGQTENDADLAKGVEDFIRIFDDSDDKGQREFSLYRIIEILMKKGDLDEAANRANQYLTIEPDKALGFNKYKGEVGLMLAQSFDKRGRTEDAISMYLKVWSAQMGFIKVSAPAMLAWMDLLAKRNKPGDGDATPSDRQGAYNGGRNYIDLTRNFKEKMSKEEQAMWQKVEKKVDELVADPAVKSKEELEKAKKDK